MFDKIVDLFITVWDHLKPIIFIIEYDNAVVYRGGKYIKLWKPGWHFRIPFVDEYHTENMMVDTMNIPEINITTLDGKTATVGCEFDLYVKDIYKAVVETADWRTNLVDICRGVMSDYLEEYNWDEIRKKTTKNAIQNKIQKRAEEIGIKIENFNFTDKALSRILKLFNN